MDSVFGTPASNPTIAITSTSMGAQMSPELSRYGENGVAPIYPNAPIFPRTGDIGPYQGALGEGTIHVACIAQAGSEMLLRSQNPAYIAATHRIEVLSSRIQQLEGQITGQKQALAEVLAKVPVLIGMQPTPESESAPRTSHSPSAGKPVLGLGLQYLAAPRSRPLGIRYWTKDDYSGRPRGGGAKAGQHKNSENVGQAWIEDENGRVIDGGQATSCSRKLGHEARVYIHSVLGHHFRFLVICEGGQWKINELISTNYSGFTQTHLGKKTRKRRRANSTASEMEETDALDPKAPTPVDSSHEAAAASNTSSTSPTNLPPHPLLESETELYTLDNRRSVSLSPALLNSTNTPEDENVIDHLSRPLAEARPGLTADSHEHTRGSANEALGVGARGAEEMEVTDTHSGVPSALPAHASDAIDVQMLDAGSEHQMPLPSSAAPVLVDAVTTSSSIPASSLPQIPVPKPFGTTKRRTRQTEQQGASSSLPATDAISLPPSTNPSSSAPLQSAAPSLTPANLVNPSVPLDNSASPTELHVALQQCPINTASSSPPEGADTPSSTSAAAGPSSSVVPSLIQSSCRRGSTPLKARTKYKPGTISAQNFHMRDRLDENPDISFAECQALFKTLSAEQRQMYHEQVTAANKQRKKDRETDPATKM